MENAGIDLKGVQETLLMPLWGRAVETRKKKPLLVDAEAVRMVDSIAYDFTRFEKKVNPLSRASWISRSIYFDAKIREFLTDNPGGTIINIGCGLDTTYERVNNGKARWYELDFPEVIETRKRLVRETETRVFLPFSVFDTEWYSYVSDKRSVLVMMAGVIYYFEENQARALFETFAREFGYATIILDYSSKRGIQVANKKVIEDGGMDTSAYLKWGIDDIREIERWNGGIRVVDDMRMFGEHRKRYPAGKRVGMWISDALSIMSLATIRIGPDR